MKNHVPLDTDKMLAWSEDGIGWMVFNNPDKLNAMGVAMNAAIPTIMHTFRDDPDVRVVVMSGAGDRAFVSGADISEFEAQRSNPETIKKYDEIGAAAGRAYGELDKPIIAMIQGFCMGGGLLTALRADLRIASDDSQFGVPAARLGLGYGYGGVKTLVDLVGFPAAQEILLTGKRFPPPMPLAGDSSTGSPSAKTSNPPSTNSPPPSPRTPPKPSEPSAEPSRKSPKTPTNETSTK